LNILYHKYDKLSTPQTNIYFFKSFLLTLIVSILSSKSYSTFFLRKNLFRKYCTSTNTKNAKHADNPIAQIIISGNTPFILHLRHRHFSARCPAKNSKKATIFTVFAHFHAFVSAYKEFDLFLNNPILPSAIMHIIRKFAHSIAIKECNPMKPAKRLALIILPILVLSLLLLPCTALAAVNAQETQIAELAQAHEKVKSAKCIIYQRTCVVALQTEKFANKSEYDQFRQELEKEILQNYNLDKIIVSRNPKVMYAISRLEKMSETEREQAIEKFLEQYYDNDRPPMIQPR